MASFLLYYPLLYHSYGNETRSLHEREQGGIDAREPAGETIGLKDDGISLSLN